MDIPKTLLYRHIDTTDIWTIEPCLDKCNKYFEHILLLFFWTAING
jgi:hypothetical protein